MNIELYNGYNKANGFEFTLFPTIALSKTSWDSYDEYDLLLGIWFWCIEINWKTKK